MILKYALFPNLNLVPFKDLSFFFPLFIILAPAVILGLRGRTSRWYNIVASVLMVYFIFSSINEQMFTNLILLFSWQLLVIKAYNLYRRSHNSVVVYFAALIGTLLPLIFEKHLIPSPFKIIGVLGLSYLTFKCVQMVIEIKDGLIKEVKLIDFTAFFLFFPVISSGPIDRYRRFQNDLSRKPSGAEYNELFYNGVRKIFRGLLYKFIIAFFIKFHWLDPIGQPHNLLTILNYMYAYSMYLFFDFAGYSSFAVGTSYMLAVKTPENFDKPFLSSNIKDFWNRWHISLSSWFRDYVFMRIALFFTRKKIVADKYLISLIGYFILFGLMGLWHGVEGYYLIYGLYHAILMSGFELFDQINKKRKFWGNSLLWNAAAVIITFQFICFGFLIFSGAIKAWNNYLGIGILIVALLILFIWNRFLKKILSGSSQSVVVKV